MHEEAGDVTAILDRIEAGDEAARQSLWELVYDDLRRFAEGLMRRERPEHTLQCTALLNEAAARLLARESLDLGASRSHFYQTMVLAMRRVLVDHARRRNRQRRGGGRKRVPLDITVESIEREAGIDLIALDEALEKLRAVGPRECRAIELQFFAGLPIHDIAGQLGISDATVKRDLSIARIWLHRELSDDDGS